MPEKAWYDTGEDAEKVHDDEEARREKARADGSIHRFWMPAPRKDDDGVMQDSVARITFVDDVTHPIHKFKTPFVYMEHQLFLDGSWKNWYTCPKKQLGSCPLCESGNVPYLASAFTIIDHSEWSARDGTLHKDEVKLYIAKSKVLKVLRRAAAKKKGLRGWLVEVMRTSGKSPNTGDQFDFEERSKLSDETQAYDYPKLLEPLPMEKLKELVGDLETEGEEEVRF